MRRASFAGEGAKPEYSGHAEVAYEQGALRALAQLGQSGQQIADSALAGLHSTILVPLLAGMVAAFGMSPASLPQEDLSHVLQLFTAIYEGRAPRVPLTDCQWPVCEAFTAAVSAAPCGGARGGEPRPGGSAEGQRISRQAPCGCPVLCENGCAPGGGPGGQQQRQLSRSDSWR